MKYFCFHSLSHEWRIQIISFFSFFVVYETSINTLLDYFFGLCIYSNIKFSSTSLEILTFRRLLWELLFSIKSKDLLMIILILFFNRKPKLIFNIIKMFANIMLRGIQLFFYIFWCKYCISLICRKVGSWYWFSNLLLLLFCLIH